MFLSVFAPNILIVFSKGMLVPILPVFAASFDISYAVVGVVLGAEALGTLAADIPAGTFLNRVGLKWIMVIGIGVVSLSALATFWVSTPIELIAVRAAAGVGSSLWNLSRHAYLTEVTQVTNRGRVIALFGATARLGSFLGPAVGGLVAAAFGLRSPFLVQAVIAFGAVLLAIAFVRDVGTERAQTRSADRDTLVLGLTGDEIRTVVAPGVGQLLGRVIRSGRQILLPLFGSDVLGIPIAAIGWLVAAGAFLDMAFAFPAGILMDRFGRKTAIVPSFVIMSLGMALIPFTSDFRSLLAAACVIGVGNGLGSGTMLTLGADLAPRRSIRSYLGLWRFIGDGGQLTGSLTMGAIAGALGLGGAALAATGAGVLATLTFALAVPETRSLPRRRPRPGDAPRR